MHPAEEDLSCSEELNCMLGFTCGIVEDRGPDLFCIHLSFLNVNHVHSMFIVLELILYI